MLLSMLLGVGSLAALFALWIGALTYGVRPNVSGLGMGSLMSLIALPPLAVWAGSAGALVWRKRVVERAALAQADHDRAQQAWQEAQAREARQREIAKRQTPIVVRAVAHVDSLGTLSPNNYERACVSLAQHALDSLRREHDIRFWPLLVAAPAACMPELVRSAQGSEVMHFEDAAALLSVAFERLGSDPHAPGVVMLAVDAPRAMLDAAPTRFNSDLMQEVPDLDLPLRGEAGQAAVAFAVARDGEALAWLHQAADSMAAALLNGRLSSGEEREPIRAPDLLVHTAGVGKEGGKRLVSLLDGLPAFDRELDPIDDGWNVPRQSGDYGMASFWVGVAHAVERVADSGTTVLCVDCQSMERMVSLVIAAAKGNLA